MKDSTLSSATPPKEPKPLSASSIKAFMSCALAYYYERILKRPTKEWPKTIMGTLAHAIFEALRKERHLKAYNEVISAPNGGVDYRLSPSVARLVAWYQRKHKIEDKLLADLNGMLFVGLKLIDFQWVNADKDPVTGKPITYGPEHEFTITLDDGTKVRGFIDDMGQVGQRLVIRDFKSQGKRWDKEELANNIQGFIYMLYAEQAFNLPASVEFVMLRHPPTSRLPDKHLQVMGSVSDDHKVGLQEYVKNVARTLREGLTLEKAMLNVETDEGFCRNVCTHYAPHSYWEVCAKSDPEGLQPLSRHLSVDKAQEAAHSGGHLVIERHHAGCAVRWRG